MALLGVFGSEIVHYRQSMSVIDWRNTQPSQGRPHQLSRFGNVPSSRRRSHHLCKYLLMEGWSFPGRAAEFRRRFIFQEAAQVYLHLGVMFDQLYPTKDICGVHSLQEDTSQLTLWGMTIRDTEHVAARPYTTDPLQLFVDRHRRRFHR